MNGGFLLTAQLKSVLFNKLNKLVPAVHANVDIVSKGKPDKLF